MVVANCERLRKTFRRERQPPINAQQEKMRSHWAFLETLVLGRDDLSFQLQQAKALLELPVFPSNEVLWQFFSDLFALFALAHFISGSLARLSGIRQTLWSC